MSLSNRSAAKRKTSEGNKSQAEVKLYYIPCDNKGSEKTPPPLPPMQLYQCSDSVSNNDIDMIAIKTVCQDIQ